MPLRRRDVLLVAGLAGFAAAAPRAIRHFQPAFQFEPLTTLPGFRRIRGGSVSGADIVLIGVEPVSDLQRALQSEVVENPCAALFGPGSPDTGVPVAVFTDYFCPYCPDTSETVIALMNAGAPIRVTWHDLPVLGPRSVQSARAAIAAGYQARYLEMHRHLMRAALRPGPAALGALADDFGLDRDRFVRDAQSDLTGHRIERAKAAAAVFGLAGTPATVIGRTVIVGNLSKQSLEKLIAIENDVPVSERVCG